MRPYVGPRLPVGSAFPPIAEYGFLSDTETCALVAPSGNVEWMCLPRMDSPSVFGALLDRDAGLFRIGPADVNVPAARRYLPGTMVIETSWGTRGGWIIVRDVLLIGEWHHEDDRSNTHRRSPTDYDADHVLLRLVRCVNGEVQVNLDCEPAFDYGRSRAEWEYSGAGYHEGVARAEGIDVELALTTDMNMGFEGPRATARTLMKEGETHFCALGWSEHPAPKTYDDAYRRLGLDRPPLAALARPRRVPRPSLAHGAPAERADAEGADVRPDGGDGGGGHHVAARVTRRRTQLGLPLRLDQGRDLHALGPVHARLRLGGERLLLLRHGRGRGGGGPAPDHVRDRRRGGAARGHPRPPLGLRRRPSGADRQRRLPPGPARRVGCVPGLGLPPYQVPRPPSRAGVADPREAGRDVRSRTGASPTAGCGRSAASRGTSPRRS